LTLTQSGWLRGLGLVGNSIVLVRIVSGLSSLAAYARCSAQDAAETAAPPMASFAAIAMNDRGDVMPFSSLCQC
jgi:hypothetical protein